MLRAGVLALALLTGVRSAEAYEFEVRSRTVAQGFELRSFRLRVVDQSLARRRFTQALTLEIRDIGGMVARRRALGPRRRGLSISWSSYLRLDHDFGDWTLGAIDRGDGALDPIDAIDAIPELEASSLALDLLYAHLDVQGLAGGRLDLRIGRQVRLDLLDAVALDGVTARVHTPAPVAVELSAGLRVRDASPAAIAAHELDGTTGADCREYVEGATPHTGSWQIIDRSRVPTESKFTADLDYCPQRRVWMPTVGVAVETERMRALHARLSYRRSSSATVGLIGEVDRLDHPDLGLYPDEIGQAPDRGVNEERITLLVDGVIERDAHVLLTPWAGARWNLIHARFDELVAGIRVRAGDHAFTPEVARSVPSFDADSIFSVFAVEPSTDLRAGWSWRPRGRVEARAGVWGRRYQLDYGDHAHAAGGSGGARWRAGAITARVDGLFDRGWGGRRLGGTASVTWQARRWARYGLRAGLYDVDDEGDRADPFTPSAARHGSLAGGGTWEVVDGVGLHLLADVMTSPTTPGQLRVLGVLDLAFAPEI